MRACRRPADGEGAGDRPVSLNAFDFLGEKVMKSEPFCYLVGWVAGKCEEVKKEKVRDKLIWESK